MASRTQVMSIIKSFSGQANVIGIPRLYIELTGDYASAALLNQILYWSERTDDKDGWFYKSYAEWQDELCLSQYQVKRAIEGDKRSKNSICLKNLGVETILKKSKKGAPTIHYRIDEDVLVQAIYKLKGIPTSNINNVENQIMNNVDNPSSTMSTMDYQQTSQSLRTEITQENTADNISPAQETSTETDTDKSAKQLIATYKSYSKNKDGSMFQWAKTDANGLVAEGITPEIIKRWYAHKAQDEWVKKNLSGIPTWRMLVSEIIGWWKNQIPQKPKLAIVPEGERGFITDSASEGVIRYEKRTG